MTTIAFALDPRRSPYPSTPAAHPPMARAVGPVEARPWVQHRAGPVHRRRTSPAHRTTTNWKRLVTVAAPSSAICPQWPKPADNATGRVSGVLVVSATSAARTDLGSALEVTWMRSRCAQDEVDRLFRFIRYQALVVDRGRRDPAGDVIVPVRHSVEFGLSERYVCGGHPRHEVSGRHVDVDRDVEQIANVAIKTGLFEKLAAAGLPEVLAFLDPASGKHTVVSTVLASPDHEDPPVTDDDCC